MFMFMNTNTVSNLCQHDFAFDKKYFDSYDVSMSDLRGNLLRLMVKKDWNAYDLERVSGVPQPTTQRFLSGRQNEPRSYTVRKWAAALGVSEAELRGISSIDSNVSHGPNIQGRVPLISWVQAGHAKEIVDLLHPNDGFDWIDTTSQIKRHTYALRVQGDSMMPDFPEGSIIIVEPEMEPLPGDYVVAKNGDDEATFKQLIKDGSDYYLKPLNDRYPIKPLHGYHVIDVVRELVRKFR